jgi:putative FmdB family regulatory protein
MPIYQYICTDCKTEFEERASYGNSSGADYPKCKSKAKRVFAPVPIVFKGSGFYCTDNAKG